MLGNGISVKLLKILIQGKIVNGNISSDHSGVSCKNGPCLGHLLLDIQKPCAACPFMEMAYDLIVMRQIVIVKTFNHLSCRISEQSRFEVIPSAHEGIQVEPFPEMRQYFILIRKKRCKVNKKDKGFPGNIPTPDLNAQSFALGPFPPRFI